MTQWKLQQRLQQQVQENPELTDVAAEIKNRDVAHKRHALQDQSVQTQSQQELQEELQLLAKSAGNLAGTSVQNERMLAKPTPKGDTATHNSLGTKTGTEKQQNRQLQRHKDGSMPSWHGSMI